MEMPIATQSTRLKRIKSDLSRLLAKAVDSVTLSAARALIPLARLLTAQRRERDRLRSFWGTTPILTLPLLAKCDRLLGIESISLVYQTYSTTSSFDVSLERFSQPLRRYAPGSQRFLSTFVLAYALLRFDIFHFFADQGVIQTSAKLGINSNEISILRRTGKAVFVYSYGADVRMREQTLALGKWNFCVDCDNPGRYCLCDDRAGETILHRISDAATATVSLGDMLSYFPRAHHIAYWPIDIANIGYVGVREHDGPLTIAHAPNHTHFKGTRYLEQSLKRLRARGIELNLAVISGVSNDEVLKLLGEADVIADQFIGGSYGYTALEGLARGKPVLTYVRHGGLTIGAEECPFINATPDTLDDVLTWCFLNRQKLSSIGRQGRAYVERHHAVPAVAARLARLYIDTAGLPPSTNERLERFIAHEETRKDGVATFTDWHHPWGAAAERKEHEPI